MSTILTLSLALAFALAPTDESGPPDAPGPLVRVTASLTAPTLVVGQQYEVVVRLEVGDGWSASQAGIPSAILQIDAPASIDLVGKKLTTYDQLKRNEFLEEPWERLMEGSEERVRFTLREEPAEGETIGLNVVAYLANTQPREDDAAAEPGPELVFARRRVDLPIAAGAKGETSTASRRSNWGVNGTLQVGEPAEAFELPRADGTLVSLSGRLGKAPLIVSMQRAFW